MAEDERELTAVERATMFVDELYNFRDHFVEQFGLNKAGDKEAEVRQKMEECLASVDALQDEVKNKAQFFLLRGRILNVTSKYSQEAEDALGRAVKLDPGLVEAWNHLGECYWKKEDVSAAKNCFTGALSHSRNKVSLRNLSMVLRQLSGPPLEKVKLIEESVERAKEAVQLDVKDGISWLILGNAYLCEFFSKGQNPKLYQQCLQAYGQAEKDAVARENPDLHFNRAVIYKYLEDYQRALTGFSIAAQLNPSWTEAQAAETDLLNYLSEMQNMIELKGKIKPRKMESLLKSLTDRDLGPYATDQYTSKTGSALILSQCQLSELQPKVNTGKVVVGRVVCTINSTDPVPFAFCLVDAEKTCVAVTVYNLAQSAGMKIGDSAAIPEPLLKKVTISHKETFISLTTIQVACPRHLVVNGRKLGTSKEALPVLTVSTVAD